MSDDFSNVDRHRSRLLQPIRPAELEHLPYFGGFGHTSGTEQAIVTRDLTAAAGARPGSKPLLRTTFDTASDTVLRRLCPTPARLLCPLAQQKTPHLRDFLSRGARI
jgi:hypothetical protein